MSWPSSARARRAARASLAVAAILGVAILAGCGSAASQATAPAQGPASLPLATSLGSAQATWAVVPMGAAAGPNLFWQLFVLENRASRWTLATPPDVATNGAIALAINGSRSLVTGIHPSLLLGFSPVTGSADGGHTWSAGAPDPGLASVPDALAAAPHGGQLIALDHDGRAGLSSAGPGSSSAGSAGPGGWTTLTSTRALAATPAGRQCALSALTAAAFSPSGSPVLAGTCTQPGIAGIFVRHGGTWQAAGPALPASLSQQKVQVLRLTRAGGRLVALLQAGTGSAAKLLTAWTAGSRWTLSSSLPMASQAVVSSSFGSAGTVAVALTGGRAEFLSGPGAGRSWQTLPRLPQGRAVILALPAAGGIDALAADGSVLTAWRLHPGQHAGAGAGSGAAAGSGAWVKTQTMKVPIQYGSSS